MDGESFPIKKEIIELPSLGFCFEFKGDVPKHSFMGWLCLHKCIKTKDFLHHWSIPCVA